MNQTGLERLLQRLEKLHPKLIDLSLERILKLLKKLQNPHTKLPKVIHIAGTNGKGSTLSFIKQILMEHNFRLNREDGSNNLFKLFVEFGYFTFLILLINIS